VRKTATSPVAAWIKHQIARERLREVVTALEAIGIPVLAVKGVVSAHTLYPDVAERPMSDVDLRLRVRDFRAVLEALGPLPRPRLAAAYRTVVRRRVLPPYDALVLPSVASDSHAQAIRGLGYSLYGWLEGGIARRLQPRPTSGVQAIASAAAGDGIAPQRAWLHQLAGLTSGAELSLHVRGECMQPLIASGARVRVRRARFYFPGDVLAVLDARAGVVKLHRCVGYRRHAGTWCVLTQPDASSVDGDPPAPLSDVIGRVIGGECDAAAVAVPWRTRAKATRVFCVRALRWLGDRTRLLPHRSTRRV
jgi:hypothetical protein